MSSSCSGGWRPNRSIDLHLHVQPRGNPEQPDALSLSDTARRRVYRPCDVRRRTRAHDVQRRRSGLHVVDELSRRNGNPVSEFITREGGTVNTADLVGQFTCPGHRRCSTVTKSGPATMNVGQWGNFAIDVQNTGPSDAWNATIRDVLPDGATGGMCDLTPEILSAQVFAADGVTPVPGKGPLVAGHRLSRSATAARRPASSRSRCSTRRGGDRPGRAADHHATGPSSTPTPRTASR